MDKPAVEVKANEEDQSSPKGQDSMVSKAVLTRKLSQSRVISSASSTYKYCYHYSLSVTFSFDYYLHPFCVFPEV